MNLKTKGLIYRLSGVYLAKKEESEYIASKKAQDYIAYISGIPENELTVEDATGLVIGLWQAEGKFHRPMSFIRFYRPSLFFRPLAWLIDCYRAIIYELGRQ